MTLGLTQRWCSLDQVTRSVILITSYDILVMDATHMGLSRCIITPSFSGRALPLSPWFHKENMNTGIMFTRFLPLVSSKWLQATAIGFWQHKVNYAVQQPPLHNFMLVTYSRTSGRWPYSYIFGCWIELGIVSNCQLWRLSFQVSEYDLKCRSYGRST